MLSRQLAAAAVLSVCCTQAAMAQDRDDDPRISIQKGHPSVDVGLLQLDVHARLGMDLQSTRADRHTQEFGFGRRRVAVEGRLGRRLAFDVEADLAAENPWRDVVLEYRVNRALRLQTGRFKLPFSMEATTGSGNLDFVKRSRAASLLAPGRSRGAAANGRIGRRLFQYDAGIFAGDGTGGPDRDTVARPKLTAASRVTFEPFAASSSLASTVQMGASAAAGSIDEGVSALSGRAVSGDRFFEPVYWARGRRTRAGIEARWEPGPLSTSGELIVATDERRGQGTAGDTLPPLRARGWYLAASWFLTGEPQARYSKPRHGAGAFELVGRVEDVRIGDVGVLVEGFFNPRADRVPEGRDRVITVGVNWFFTRHVKVQANLVSDHVHRGTQSPESAGSATRSSRTYLLGVQLAM